MTCGWLRAWFRETSATAAPPPRAPYRVELTARNFVRFEQLGMATPFDVRTSPVNSTAVVDGNGRIN
jgi:hypothetical protein